jgi:hypothetical protein
MMCDIDPLNAIIRRSSHNKLRPVLKNEKSRLQVDLERPVLVGFDIGTEHFVPPNKVAHLAW